MATQSDIQITPELILAISMSMLHKLFDEAVPHPKCHLEWWELCCSAARFVAIAAPRGHAKSTAITFCYVICMILLRKADYVIIMSNIENQAAGFVSMISRALRELPELEQFGIKRKLLKDNATEIIGEFIDGHRFCVLAKGHKAEIRGILFDGRRPNLIVCDDLEDKESVNNDETRAEAASRFWADVVPALSKRGKLRIAGTILHDDSILNNLMDAQEEDGWLTAKYEAHDDLFENLLWPEQFDANHFKRLFRSFKRQGNTDEYYREYRSMSLNPDEAFFRDRDIQVVTPDHFRRMNLTKYIVVDPAVTENKKNDLSGIGVFGVDYMSNIYLIDAELCRMETPALQDLIFDLVERYEPEEVVMESGVIKHAIGPYIEKEMAERNRYFVLEGVTPHRSKRMRAQPIRARMRAGKVFLSSEIECLDAWIEQLKKFDRAKHDDAVDVMAYMGLRLNDMTAGLSEEEEEAREQDELDAEYILAGGDDGRDSDTGY